MKKNKWVLLLIAFVAFLVLVYFIGACLNATAEALTIISLCIGISLQTIRELPFRILS